VHVQAAYSGPDPVRETAWLQTIADQHGFPHAIIAYCDLASPGARTQLDRHRAHRNMRGVRTFTEDDALLAGSFQRGIAVLGEYGLSYEMQIGHQSMWAARRLADLHAHVQFVLEHAGLPMGRDEGYYQIWRKGLGHLAGAPNVAVKVSGLGMTDHAWSVASIRRWVTAVIEAFGAGRVMFGSNWPVDSLYSDYRTLADAYRQIVAEFSEAEQHLLLHLNAERIYRLTGE
jgi:predicted TIM-barrel fold metal-dependent hydrolase